MLKLRKINHVRRIHLNRLVTADDISSRMRNWFHNGAAEVDYKNVFAVPINMTNGLYLFLRFHKLGSAPCRDIQVTASIVTPNVSIFIEPHTMDLYDDHRLNMFTESINTTIKTM